MKYYLTHQTTLKNLEAILKSKALLSPKKSGSSIYYGEGLEEEMNEIVNSYKTKIFTSLIIPIKKIIREYPYDEYTWRNDKRMSINLIFDCEKVLKDKKVKKFYCKYWNFGIYDKDCFHYNNEISYNDNINLWIDSDKKESEERIRKNKYSITSSILHNEVVIENKLPLKHLKYIYIQISKNGWKNSDVLKIEKLKNLYPQYEWVIEIPKIPFYSEKYY